MVVLALVLCAFTPQVAAASTPRVDRCRHIDWRESRSQVGRLVRCLAWSFNSPGTPRYAARIAWCESRWNPRAYSNGNAGVFQHRLIYWDGRYRAYAKPLGLRWSPYNALTNIVVSVRMAKSAGNWRAWSCA